MDFISSIYLSIWLILCRYYIREIYILFYIVLLSGYKRMNFTYLFLLIFFISFTVGAADQQADDSLKLYTAAKDGQLATVRMMLASGVSADAKNAYGRTALMGAVYNQNYGIIHELLSEGADVNVADVAGKTALMLAVIKQNLMIVSDLIYAGADVTAKDKDKKTAIDLAKKIGNEKLLELLQTAGK